MLLNSVEFTGTALNSPSVSLSVNCLSPVTWKPLKADGWMSVCPVAAHRVGLKKYMLSRGTSTSHL